ncbi:MAG: hypothetical protein GX219_03855 [Tissierellia bacterium]|nr:hypothetical protein [Tissierellia bacterium]
MPIKKLIKQVAQLNNLLEGINKDKAIRKNIDKDSPNINFVKKDLELTIMREDKLLKRLNKIEEEYKSLDTYDERLETNILMTKRAILRLKEEDLKLLSFIDSSIIPRLNIAGELGGINEQSNSKHQQ